MTPSRVSKGALYISTEMEMSSSIVTCWPRGCHFVNFRCCKWICRQNDNIFVLVSLWFILCFLTNHWVCFWLNVSTCVFYCLVSLLDWPHMLLCRCLSLCMFVFLSLPIYMTLSVWLSFSSSLSSSFSRSPPSHTLLLHSSLSIPHSLLKALFFIALVEIHGQRWSFYRYPYNTYWTFSPFSGCVPCNCNTFGSANTQCADTGVCTCLDHVDVTNTVKCDRCVEGFFGLPNAACQRLYISYYISNVITVQLLGRYVISRSNYMILIARCKTFNKSLLFCSLALSHSFINWVWSTY